MTRVSHDPAIDEASLLIHASPEAIYAAFVDPDAMVKWMPPAGMIGRMELFEPRPGGRYRMTLTYPENSGERGKAGDGSDIVQGQFGELVQGERVEQSGVFESDDPAFAGTMRVLWTFRPEHGATRVTVRAENVPPGIDGESHDQGMRSSLENLAAYLA
jgi:uncharacterized protein YndB with AHSA1/START domain